MEAVATYLSELNNVTVLLRVILAALIGGIIGTERGLHGRAAGMRTHMLVCLGATLTTLLGVYMWKVMGVTWADPMRIGAQVVSGVGFLGAGTIMLKKSSGKVNGLTTAAGVWTTAIIGLAIGAGFYLGAIASTVAVVLAFTVISSLEAKISGQRQRLAVYLEIENVSDVTTVMDYIKARYGAAEIRVTAPYSATPGHVGVEALIKVPRKHTVEERIQDLQEIEHVIFATLAS